MAIIGVGTDIIEIGRIKKAANDKFLQRYFSDDENAMFNSNNKRPEMIAGNFCAKEAFVKGLGTGFNGINPKHIEVLRDKKSRPYIILYGPVKSISDDLGVIGIHVSISHSREYATAFVVLESSL